MGPRDPGGSRRAQEGKERTPPRKRGLPPPSPKAVYLFAHEKYILRYFQRFGAEAEAEALFTNPWIGLLLHEERFQTHRLNVLGAPKAKRIQGNDTPFRAPGQAITPDCKPKSA